jgi:tetratricopeptide (TPR) repeat protein
MFRTALIAAIFLVVGFVGGFLISNSINRNSANSQDSTQANKDVGGGRGELTSEDIEAAEAALRKEPNNFILKKRVGIAFYSYGFNKPDVGILERAERILEEARLNLQNDLELLITLGNSRFDIAFFGKRPAYYAKARESYLEALTLDPKNVTLFLDIGNSYAFGEVPNHKDALSYYTKGLQLKPTDERLLQVASTSSIATGDSAAARKYLETLRKANASSPAITEIEKALKETK